MLQQIEIFFFQAEDGIRDTSVTGVQTCALPICPPVVLMTGGGSEQSAVEAFRLGVKDYLVKPFTIDRKSVV